MPSTTTFSEIKADLIRDEGYKDKPYKDTAGHLTIGVGHNLDAKGLCPAAILAQLDFDLEQTQQDLDQILGWWKNTPPDVQRVLVNLAFNMGANRLLSFKNTLQLIHDAKYKEAADALLQSLYAKQVGQRAVRLANLLRSVV
jgi:lysozyme